MIDASRGALYNVQVQTPADAIRRRRRTCGELAEWLKALPC